MLDSKPESLTASYTYANDLLQETYSGSGATDTVSYRYDNSVPLASVSDSASGTKLTYYYDFTEKRYLPYDLSLV